MTACLMRLYYKHSVTLKLGGNYVTMTLMCAVLYCVTGSLPPSPFSCLLLFNKFRELKLIRCLLRTRVYKKKPFQCLVLSPDYQYY